MPCLALCADATPRLYFSTVLTRPQDRRTQSWSGLEFPRRANAVGAPSALHASYAHLSRAVVKHSRLARNTSSAGQFRPGVLRSVEVGTPLERWYWSATRGSGSFGTRGGPASCKKANA